MDTTFRCEFRSIKGVPILVPEGGRAMIRAQVAPGVLPERFGVVRGRAALRGPAARVELAQGETDGILPNEGVPECVTGVVVEHLARGLLVDAGVLLHVELPGELEPRRFKLGSRVSCHFSEQIAVEGVVLDPSL